MFLFSVLSVGSEQRGCTLFHRERAAWETNRPVRRVKLKYLAHAKSLLVVVMDCVSACVFTQSDSTHSTYPVPNQDWPAF